MTTTTQAPARRGFILPIVLIAAALATALGGALVTAAFHATRGARMAWHGERALHAADLALATASQAWTPARIANTAVGTREMESSLSPDGITVDLTITRTSASTLLINAVATASSGPTTIARRELSRLLYLDASAIPLRAALSTFGPLEADAGTTVSAAGNDTGDENSCGLHTDTASTAALLTLPPLTIDSTAFIGAPAIRFTTADSASAFRTAIWQRIAALHLPLELTTGPTTITPLLSGTSCTGNSGEPRRNITAVTPCITHWPTRRLSSTSGRVTLATSRHQGALIIDGDLEVAGHLELRGLLVVAGAVDTRNGSLDVVGALIATHHTGGTTRLGNSARVRWSRCAALRAVTPLATSASPPVLTWLQRW